MIYLKKYIVLTAVAILFATAVYCQNWQSIGMYPSGVNYAVRELYSDTVTNKLYIGGGFTMIDSIPANLIATWNGTQFDTLGHGFRLGTNVLSIIRYNDTIFAGGALRPDSSLFKWNGLNWDLLYPNVNQTVVTMNEINGELYVGGTFDSVGSFLSPDIVKWNGSNCIPLVLNGWSPSFSNDFVFSIASFQNDLYIAGSFDIGGIKENILRWDGNNANSVGGGIIGGVSEVSSMVVFNGELYVGGYFTVSAGNASNFIMKWNGLSWSDVGGGMDDDITDMKVYNNQLYVTGVFNHAGGVSASKIARWDGAAWHALSSEIFDNNITCFDFYNNELYVGGGFHYIDTVFAKFIARYTGALPNGLTETENGTSFSIFPNPANKKFTLQFSSPLRWEYEINVFNMLGEKIFKQKLHINQKQVEVDVSQWSQGVYTCQLSTSENAVVKKFIKE